MDRRPRGVPQANAQGLSSLKDGCHTQQKKNEKKETYNCTKCAILSFSQKRVPGLTIQANPPMANYALSTATDEHNFDLSITVCDNAKDNCPVFLNSSRSLHWSYPDPADITDFESRKSKLLEIYYDLGKRLNQL